MAGLRREWIDLTNVADSVLKPAMQGIIDDRSPYNKAENMTVMLHVESILLVTLVLLLLVHTLMLSKLVGDVLQKMLLMTM